MTPSTGTVSLTTARTAALLANLRPLALQALARMYRPEQYRFAFRLRRGARGIEPEGSSHRYTAIALIGLAHERAEAVSDVLRGHTRLEVCERLLDDAASLDNVGDVALTHWAAIACGASPRAAVRMRLLELIAASAHATIELSWTLAACSHEPARCGDVMAAAGRRLLAAFDQRSELFPHVVAARWPWWRHVTSFADLIYPVHALARYHIATGDQAALRVATRCANRLCTMLGPAGQWWWHYDVRTGQVVEQYPVYSVHQSAMAPMAFFELAEAGGPYHLDAIERGLDWLQAAPELSGKSLIDAPAGVIWRKVGRRDAHKLARRLQALASRLHPALRVPAIDRIFPPGIVDEECRPYHLGWLLYAWRVRHDPARSARKRE